MDEEIVNLKLVVSYLASKVRLKFQRYSLIILILTMVSTDSNSICWSFKDTVSNALTECGRYDL